MPEQDFLYALKEDLPEDFKRDLKQQLDQLEAETEPPRSSNRAWWTVAVASIITVMLSAVIFTSGSAVLPFMKPALVEPLPTDHSLITTANISLIEPFTTLGHAYAHDIAAYGDTLLIATDDGIYEHSGTNLHAPARHLTDEPARNLAVDSEGNIYFQNYDDPVRTTRLFRWDRQTGEVRLIRDIEESPTLNYDALYVSEDDRSIYVSTCRFIQAENSNFVTCEWSLHHYDIQTGEKFWSQSHISTANTVTQSRDKRSLLFYTYEIEPVHRYVLNRVDTNSGEITPLFFTPTLQWFPSHNLALSPDGKTVALGSTSSSGISLFWDIDNLLQIEEIPDIIYPTGDISFTLHTPPFSWQMSGDFFIRPTSILFDPTGDYLIQSSDWNWHVYKVGEEVTSQTYPTPVSAFEQVEYSADGSLLFGMYRGIIYAFDATTWEQLDQLTSYVSPIGDVSLNANSTKLLSSNPPIIWDLTANDPSPRLMTNQGRVFQMRHAVISPDGQYIVYQVHNTTSETYGIILQNLDTGTTHRLAKLVTPMADITFLADNTLLVTSTLGAVYRVEPENFENDGDEVPYHTTTIDHVLFNETTAHDETSIIFSSDGTLAALWDCTGQKAMNRVCDATTLRLWDMTTSQEIIEIADPAFLQAGTLSFSPDDQQLAISFCIELEEITDTFSMCDRSEVRLYNVEQLRNGDNRDPVAAFQTKDPATLNYHPQLQADGSYLLSMTLLANQFGETRIYSVDTSGNTNLAATFDDIDTPVTFSPDGRFMITTGLELWAVPPTN